MPSSSLVGAWGEEQAARYLRLHGYSIMERNFSCRTGELDIVAKKGKFIVFAEVKTRKNAKFAEAREFVTYAKQQRIFAAAQMYLTSHDGDLQPRFDVIEVYAPEGLATKKPELRHWEDAFESDSFL